MHDWVKQLRKYNQHYHLGVKAQLKQIWGKACPEKALWGPAQLQGSPSQIINASFSAKAWKVHMPQHGWLRTTVKCRLMTAKGNWGTSCLLKERAGLSTFLLGR